MQPNQASAGGWRLRGHDTFSSEDYPLPGSYETESLAVAAAERRLAELERGQPAAHSGGQGPLGIQDRVFVIRPDGSEYRFVSLTDPELRAFLPQMASVVETLEACLAKGQVNRPRLGQAVRSLSRHLSDFADALDGGPLAEGARAAELVPDHTWSGGICLHCKAGWGSPAHLHSLNHCPALAERAGGPRG